MMLIASFNVNSVRTRLPVLERVLKSEEFDCFFLQETKTQDQFFPEPAFTEWGYKSYYPGEKSYNGVAALVRNDAEVSFGFEDGTFSTRVLTLRHKGLTILNTYVPQGKSIDHPDFGVKKEFFAKVRKVIEREKDGLFLWLGDMNVAPEEIDVTHPEDKKKHVCFCGEIRKVFADTRAGLVDLLRKFHAEAGVYTFYDYRTKDAVSRGIGWRIDHMFASEALASHARECYPCLEPRTWEKPSDHVPLIGIFEL